MTLSAGTRLGPYEILSPLGAGGMGVRRFEQEARAVAALSHSDVLTPFDIGRERDRLSAVLELRVGEALRMRMSCSAPSWAKADRRVSLPVTFSP